MSEKNPTTKEMIADIVDFVRRSDPRANLSLGRMAGMVGRDRTTVGLAFKEQMGLPYTDFLQRNRIERSMRYMTQQAQGRKPFEADAVTKAAGLKDIEAFRLLFERETGGTPFDFFQRSKNVLKAVIENSIQKFEAGTLPKSVKNIEDFVDAQMRLWLEREIKNIGNPDPALKGLKKDYSDQVLPQGFRNLPAERKAQSAERMDEVRAFLLNADLEHENLALETVAEKFSYGRSGFQRAFTSAMGKSYSAFVEEVRVNTAKKLLSDMVPKAVAPKVGMKERAFRDMFKKNTGLTPSAFQAGVQQALRENALDL